MYVFNALPKATGLNEVLALLCLLSVKLLRFWEPE